jgi:hypothetical protein
VEPVPALTNDVYRFSVKRIKKKINDFILNNYQEIFFTTGTASDDSHGGGTSEDSPAKDKKHLLPEEYQTKYLSAADFISNHKILHKAQEELKFCEE